MKAIAWFGLVLGAVTVAGEVIITQPGKKAVMECGVDSYQKTIEWLKGTDRIMIYGPRFRKPITGNIDIASRSVLITTDLRISMVKEEDAGQFTCKTDGVTHEHTLVVYSVSSSSPGDFQLGGEATLECRVRGLSQGVAVQWIKPDGSTHPGSETLQLKPLSRSDAGKWTCKFSLESEEHTASLEIRIEGPAPTPPPLVTSHRAKNQPKPPPGVPDPSADSGLLLGLSWWMWAVIGGSALVALVLTVVVVLLSRRIKRRKRNLQKVQNGRRYCQCDRPAAAAKPRQGRRREKPSVPPLQPLLMA